MYMYTAERGVVEREKLLGKGGEGEVWSTRCGDAIKIFGSDTNLQRKERKIDEMLRNPPREPHGGSKGSFAWPREKVYRSDSSSFVGYIMEIYSDCQPLNELTVPDNYPPGLHWGKLLQIALNVCFCVDALHKQGYVVGDLNRRNILANPGNCLVALIDCDSIQVKSSTEVFTCNKTEPDYLAPELHGCNLELKVRDKTADLFSLSVIICQLLLLGRHPHSGGARSKIIDNIRNGSSFVVQNDWSDAPAWTPPREILNQNIVLLLKKSFLEGHDQPSYRPTAQDWVDILKRAANNIKRCSLTASHYYEGHLNQCPWCHYESRVRRRIFVDRTAVVTSSRNLSSYAPPVRNSTTQFSTRPSTLLAKGRSVLILFRLVLVVSFLLVLVVSVVMNISMSNYGQVPETTAIEEPDASVDVSHGTASRRQNATVRQTQVKIPRRVETQEDFQHLSTALESERIAVDYIEGKEKLKEILEDKQDDKEVVDFVNSINISRLSAALGVDHEFFGDLADLLGQRGWQENEQVLLSWAALQVQESGGEASEITRYLSEIRPREGFMVLPGPGWLERYKGQYPGGIGRIVGLSDPDGRDELPGWVIVEWQEKDVSNRGLQEWYHWQDEHQVQLANPYTSPD